MVTPADISPSLGVFAFVLMCTCAIPIALVGRFIIELLTMFVCLYLNWYSVVPFSKRVNLYLFVILYFPSLYLIFSFIPLLTEWIDSLTEWVKR